jgi:DNA-binding HxlR family transcriptional regulator
MDRLEPAVEELAVAPPEELSARLREASTAARPLFALLGRTGTLELLYHVATHEPVRFTELKEELGMSSATLSTRLSELVEAGFVDRTSYDENPPRAEYASTDALRDLKPMFYHVLAWAERHDLAQVGSAGE